MAGTGEASAAAAPVEPDLRVELESLLKDALMENDDGPFNGQVARPESLTPEILDEVTAYCRSHNNRDRIFWICPDVDDPRAQEARGR